MIVKLGGWSNAVGRVRGFVGTARTAGVPRGTGLVLAFMSILVIGLATAPNVPS